MANFITVGSLALIVTAVFSLITLTPSYIIIKMQEAQVSSVTPGQSAEILLAKKDLSQAQSVVSQLSTFATSTTLLDTLAAILGDRPRGVRIENIEYSRSPKGSIFSLEGTSASREGINSFQLSLKADKHFQSVSVPVSALAGAGDGRFTVAITGAF